MCFIKEQIRNRNTNYHIFLFFYLHYLSFSSLVRTLSIFPSHSHDFHPLAKSDCCSHLWMNNHSQKKKGQISVSFKEHCFLQR